MSGLAFRDIDGLAAGLWGMPGPGVMQPNDTEYLGINTLNGLMGQIQEVLLFYFILIMLTLQ